MRKPLFVVLALSLTLGCDITPPRAKDTTGILTQGFNDVRMAPAAVDLRVGDRVAFSATYHGSGPRWTWIVTDTVVARIHPDSGTLQALHAGYTNVIATSVEQPMVRGVAPVTVR